MNKYIEYVERFQEGNEYGLFFLNNQYKKEYLKSEPKQNDIEHILDFVYSKKKNYKSLGYKTILEKANAWSKKIQQQASKEDNEIEGKDYEVVKDFKDGFRFVRLISKGCYEREGKLMSHCVSSYFGRDVKIYSLRDKSNLPHATIEENNQVKGKGNQTVDNKYFAYCIEFLEEMGFSIGENEMRNIGYYKLDSIDKGLSCDKEWEGYVSEKDIDKIRDGEGRRYEGFGLLHIKKLVEVKVDYSLKWNFNINVLLKYINTNITNKINVANNSSSTAVANSTYSTAVANKHSSTAVANKHSSTAVANSTYSTAVANSTYSTAVANGGYSTAVANGGYSTAVANESYSTAVANKSSSTAVANESSSTAVANEHSSTAVANKSYSTAVANEHSSTAVANESSSTAVANESSSTAVANEPYSTAVANGKNGIALARGTDSKARGKVGAWLVIAENDKEYNIIDVQCRRVDGKIIREDTFYASIGGEFIEVEK